MVGKDEDYKLITEQLTWEDNETAEKNLIVDIFGDEVIEDDVPIYFELVNFSLDSDISPDAKEAGCHLQKLMTALTPMNLIANRVMPRQLP